ncbi:unnamed protein product [Rhizophagus irregularis]|nr:unnamed protein product [Rhizophagus irregularis]
MQNKSCLICHVLFASVSSLETPFLTKCCNRWVCDSCLEQNRRYYTYCPFCQEISITYSNTSYTDCSLPTYEEVIYNDLNKPNNTLNYFNEKSDKKLDEKITEFEIAIFRSFRRKKRPSFIWSNQITILKMPHSFIG